MNKNRLGALLIAATLTLTAGSALLLGNRFDATRLGAGQTIVKRVATWTPNTDSNYITIDTENVNYQKIPVQADIFKYSIDLTPQPTNNFSFGTITRVFISFKSSFNKVVETRPSFPGAPSPFVYQLRNINDDTITLKFYKSDFNYVAETTMPFEFTSKLSIISEYVGNLEFKSVLDYITFDYDCINS